MEKEPPSLHYIILFTSLEAWDVFAAFFLVVLLAFSAMASGSEVAYFSLGKKELDQARDEDLKGWQKIVDLLENRKKLLATILILNNAINIGIVLLAAYLSSIFVHPFLENYTVVGVNLVVIFDIGIITFLLLLFGEIIPKIYAGKKPFQFAHKMNGSLFFARWLFSPVSALLLGMNSLLEKGLTPDKGISVDQLSQALELTSEDKTTSEEEQKILEGIVTFGATETRQIMTPRVDLFALRLDASFESVCADISQRGFSRVPVFDENIDQIKGVLYAKDLIPYLQKKSFEWQNLLREAFYVPEKKKLNDLLSDFQERKVHLAVVVDEYGGLQGVVSLEDVIEEIVGDISDEFDDDDVQYSKIDSCNFVFEGKTSIKDFCRIMEIDSVYFEAVSAEAETIAGLVLEITDNYPNKRQVIHYKDIDFTIEALDKRRIKQIKVTQNAN